MTPLQQRRLHGIIESIYADAASSLQKPRDFSATILDALHSAGFGVQVIDITVPSGERR